MEVLGQRPATVEMHLHQRAADGQETHWGQEFRDPALRAGWHTYAIDWRPGRLQWLVDGTARFEVNGAAVPVEPMYLVANLAVGGDWPGKPSRATHFPARLAVDYVRVWR